MALPITLTLASDTAAPFAVCLTTPRTEPEVCAPAADAHDSAATIACSDVAAIPESSYVLARCGAISLEEPYASAIAPERHALFLADGAVHLAAYGVGFAGGLVVCILAWRRRNSRR